MGLTIMLIGGFMRGICSRRTNETYRGGVTRFLGLAIFRYIGVVLFGGFVSVYVVMIQGVFGIIFN